MTDKSDLEALLNQSPQGETAGVNIEETDTPPSPDLSETVLHIDKWGMRRAHELLRREWNQDGNATPDSKWCRHCLDTLADAHTACFEPVPKLDENPQDRVRSKWFEQLLSTPEYRAMHSQTCLDDALSEIGTKQLAGQWQTYLESLTEQEQKDIEDGFGDPDGGNESIESEMKRIRSCNQAVQQAEQDVSEAQDAARGLGLGDGTNSRIDGTEMLKLFQKVRNNADLRRIIELTGAYKRVAQSCQRRKSFHGRDDMVGIEMGGDPARLVPSELAMLADPDLELDVLRRIAERQALCREYRGMEPVAKGPIVVCVDESGSTSGEPHAQAKAFALSMGWIAKFQNRWIAFVGFATAREGTLATFPPGQWDQEKLIGWLTHFYDGGTSLHVPCVKLPFEYWNDIKAPRGKTDIVIITDARLTCPDGMRDKFLNWKQEEHAKCYGLVIGQHDVGELAKICNRCWTVPVLNVEQDVVSEILSI